MIEASSSTVSVALLNSDTPRSQPRSGSRAASQAASAATHGVDPMTPAASASHNSGVRYHHTVYAVGAGVVAPAIALKKATAPGGVSARKKTHPIMTTASVYRCGQIGQARMPERASEPG